MKKIYKDWFRKWHRDIGYFFVGLILSFSISGIALNHRETFDSRDIIYKTEPIQIDIDKISDNLDGIFINNFSSIDLSKQVKRLIEDQTFREKLGNNGYEKSIQRMNPETCAFNVFECYNRIMKI